MAVVIVLAALLWVWGAKYFSLFLLLGLVSSFWPFYDKASYFAFHSVLYAMIWIMLVMFFMGHHLDILLDAMCIIALANVVFVLLQLSGIWLLYQTTKSPVGLMANPNETSALIAFCAPAFWRGKWKYALPALIIGLFCVNSFAGPLSLGCGVVVYAFLKGKIYLSLGLVLCAVLLYGLLIDLPGMERWQVWKRGLQLFKEHWVFGSGLGHWKYIFIHESQAKLFDGIFWKTAHNEYLQGMFEMGIGFIILVAGYFQHVVRHYKKEALIGITALVIIAVNSFVNFPFHIANTAMIAVTWMAILEIQLKPLDRSKIEHQCAGIG